MDTLEEKMKDNKLNKCEVDQGGASIPKEFPALLVHQHSTWRDKTIALQSNFPVQVES